VHPYHVYEISTSIALHFRFQDYQTCFCLPLTSPLGGIPQSGYFSPDAMVPCLFALTSLYFPTTRIFKDDLAL
jgi:hypothetical protein